MPCGQWRTCSVASLNQPHGLGLPSLFSTINVIATNSLFSLSRHQNKNANHSIQKVLNLGMKEDKYTKKPRQESDLCGISYARDIRKNVLPKFVKLCMETPFWCPFEEHKYSRRKPTKTSVFEFSNKCVNSSLEKLMNITVTFILRQGMFRWQNLKKSVTLLTHIRSIRGLPATS